MQSYILDQPFTKKTQKMKKKESMNVINPNAAGIDVGSKSHFVSIGQQAEDVKEYGVYTKDHEQLIQWLSKNGITTIAMESTGSYWQTLFSALQKAGFEVLLVNGRQIKNVKGKTDVKDCQWIQKLHSLGLLTGSFLPSAEVEKLRTYQRHRAWLIEQCAKMSNKMQKALRLMNLRLDVVLNDITSKSGMAIIRAILDGEFDGTKLALLVNGHVKKTREEIANALKGNRDEGLMLELRDCVELNDNYNQRIIECDHQIELIFRKHLESNQISDQSSKKLTRTRPQRHQPSMDVSFYSYGYTGVDLFAIEGVKHQTVMTFLSEVGADIFKFPTSKNFVSWLRLAPNNKISGGKTISSRTPKAKNRLAIALRNAANTIGKSKKGTLKRFFDRIAYRKGRAAAITATARKLAVIIWKMVHDHQPYMPTDEKLYEEKIRLAAIANIKNKMKRLNLSFNELSLE